MPIKPFGYSGSHYDSANAQTLINRSAANVVKSGVYFVDVPQADPDSTDINQGLNNAVLVTTARMALRLPLVVADPSQTDAVLADNVPFRAIEGEQVICQVLVDGTTDIAKGDWLKPVNNQTYMVKGTLNTDYVYAQALEAYTTDSTQKAISVILYSSGRL